MKNKPQTRTYAKIAGYIVIILLFLTLPLILGNFREMRDIIYLGSVQEMESVGGSLELIGEDSRVKIGGYPLAEIPAPTHRTTATDLPVSIMLTGHSLIAILTHLSLIFAALSIARYFFEVYKLQVLIVNGAFTYYRRAALSLAIGLIVLPIISYFFYQATVGSSYLNLGVLLIHLALILFVEFFGRLLKDSSFLKQESEQFI